MEVNINMNLSNKINLVFIALFVIVALSAITAANTIISDDSINTSGSINSTGNNTAYALITTADFICNGTGATPDTCYTIAQLALDTDTDTDTDSNVTSICAGAQLLLANGSCVADTVYINLNVNSSDYWDNVGQPENITWDQLDNPAADKTWTFPNNVEMTFRSNDNTPAAGEGIFNFETLGAFTGELVHIHQHTGNPGVSNLLRLESSDSDVNGINISSAGSWAIYVMSGGVLFPSINISDQSNISAAINNTGVPSSSITGLNTTIIQYNTSMSTYIDAISAIWNTSMQVYVDAIDAIWNTSMDTYVDAVDAIWNTSIATYADAMDLAFNNSVAAYFTAQDTAYNTSMDTYVDAKDAVFNTSMDTYVDAKVANINSTTNYINTTVGFKMNATNKICLNGDACTKYIQYNGTAVIIQG